jgi:hypothetical protein
MAPPRLPPQALTAIEVAVKRIFNRIRARALGLRYPAGKHLTIGYRPELTLQGIFDAAQTDEGVKPRAEVIAPVIDVAGKYLDAAEARTQAKIGHEIHAFLHEAQQKGVKTSLATVLGGKIAEVYGQTSRDVKRILETEANISHNTGAIDGIGRVAAGLGIDDPVMVQIHPLDEFTCAECLRICYMPDKLTPRAWRMSELSAGYHKKGDDVPSLGGQHPNCRGRWTQVLPGYGFTAGKVDYISPDYDLIADQRGEKLGKADLKGWAWAPKMMEEPRAYFHPETHEWESEEPSLMPVAQLNSYTDDDEHRRQHSVAAHGRPGDPHFPHGRPEACDEVINSMAKALRRGRKFPPLLVERTEKGLRLADGNHRLTAAKRLGMTHVPVIVMRKRTSPG